VDLTKVAGTGAGGRITKADVLGAVGNQPVAAAAVAPSAKPAPASTPAPARPAPAAPTGPVPGTTEKLSRLRKVIAERMVESLRVSAQLTTVVEVDVTRITALRNRVKTSFEQREGVKLTFMPFFVKAAVEALKQYPQVNASIDMAAGTVTYFSSENIGIAVDTERGLLVPVVHNAGELNIAGISRRIADLAERTRTGKVSPDDLSGGTFTVTNTGSRGALFDTPIVNQPQVAILGTGAVVKRPIVVTDDGGQDVIAIRSMVYLALSYDHRLVDGADAARFLNTMKSRLEEAAFDAELGL
jgi:2-oxoglutarate dehydrogenase E2 component (dihydrolipoamide succinyltransferase)